MILQKSTDLICFFKHDGLVLELEQEVISSIGLIEILKKAIKTKYPTVKSFGLSLVKESAFEVQISVLSDMPWKV